MSEQVPPLYERVILVTRPADRNAALKQRLESLGAKVDARPTIDLELPQDIEPARRALRDLSGYAWVVFTSPGGVGYFEALGRRVLGRAPRPGCKVAAIGPATAAALRQSGVVPAVVATQSSAEGLVEALGGRVGPQDRVLLVRPEEAREMLPHALRAAGAVVEAVPFYRNVAARDVPDIAADVRRGAYDLVVFTSPSTALRLFEGAAAADVEIRSALRRAKIVAIGEVTARALAQLGIPAGAVATSPTDDGIVDAVCSLFR
jgi:uroporphyrinogen III methyltransferase/synthase